MINQTGENETERKRVADSLEKDGFITNANDIQYKDGKAVASSITPASADSISEAIGTSQGRKMGESMKSMIVNGYEVKNAGENIHTKKDNSSSEVDGNERKTLTTKTQQKIAENEADYNGDGIVTSDEKKRYLETSEATEFGSKFQNYINNAAAMVGVEADLSEEQAVGAAVVTGGGVTAAGYNLKTRKAEKFTKAEIAEMKPFFNDEGKQVGYADDSGKMVANMQEQKLKTEKFSSKELSKMDPSFDNEGKFEGYKNADGKIVANAAGEKLHPSGEIVQSGKVTKMAKDSWNTLWNSGDRFFGGESTTNSVDGSSNKTTDPGKNNNGANQQGTSNETSKNEVHDDPLNKDSKTPKGASSLYEDIITKQPVGDKGLSVKIYEILYLQKLNKMLKIKFQFAIFLSLTCRNSYYYTMKIHIDIDCFFASAARIIEPELEGKPIAIGGRSDTKIFDASAKKQTVNFENSGNFVPTFYKAYEASDDDLDAFKDPDGRIRGILTTASYEAREYGIKTAMSIREALGLCPQLIIKAPNMSLYQKLSHQLHEFLQTRIPLVEQASIDEFYGDLAGWIEDEEVPWFIDNLRHEIKKETKLPVSIGAAKTRYIAKLATTYAKPFGCKTIYPHMEAKFIDPIKVENFAGIGRSMREKLHSAQIFTLGELKKRRGTVESWGPYAKDLYMRVCGISDAPIKTDHQRKSIGISRTFDPIFDRAELRRRVHILARHLSFAILKLGVVPTVYHLSISYEMRQKSHKNVSLCEIFTEKKFDSLCLNLFNEADVHKRLYVIRLSINCSSFTRDSKKELSLIGFEDEQKMNRLTQNTYELRTKYGLDALKWGSEL